MGHGSLRRIVALALALALAFAGAAAPTPAFAASPAAEPERLSAKPFDVSVAGGVVTVSFTLAMSDVNSYPVTITAICCSTEEVLYQGTLGEGSYRFRAPLTKISGHGDLKVVLKTKVTNRSERGTDSFIVYLRWQGAI